MAKHKNLKVAISVIVLLPILVIIGLAIASPDRLMNLFIPAPPAAEPPPAPVKFTVDTTPVALFLDHPVARKWLDRYFPGFREEEQVDLTRRMTLTEAQPYFPDSITLEALRELGTKLEPLPPLQPVVVYSSKQTELGTLLDDPDARAIIDKHLNGFTQDDRISMARPFTLVFLQNYLPDVVTDERCDTIDKAFAELAESRAEEIEL